MDGWFSGIACASNWLKVRCMCGVVNLMRTLLPFASPVPQKKPRTCEHTRCGASHPGVVGCGRFASSNHLVRPRGVSSAAVCVGDFRANSGEDAVPVGMLGSGSEGHYRIGETGKMSIVQGCGRRLRMAVIGAGLGLAPATALADCGNDAAGFAGWLERFKAKATAEGISKATLKSALGGVSYDRTVVHLDRNQKSFKLSFEQFYARRVGTALIRRGHALMRTHKATLDRVEKRFGVPAPVLIAIWGLETNYGADTSGKFSLIRSVATLAYDCRRSPFFTAQLMDALRIVQAGDMTAAELRGGWAGEIG